jgi:precorrin-6B methylase 1
VDAKDLGRVYAAEIGFDEIRLLTADADDSIDGADVVPGWRLPLAELFRGR